MSRPLIIAIDGPSGTGKSSVSRGLAKILGLSYLDTGAMYRAVAWHMLQAHVDLADAEAIAAESANADVQSGTDPSAPTISVNGTDVSGPIREQDVTSAVSAVAAVPAVRQAMVSRQRQIVEQAVGGIVVEGRDIGSVVLPDAPVKIFLTADENVRAARRSGENGQSVAATQAALNERDRADSTRAVSPLTQADGAYVVDSTHLNLEEVIEAIKEIVEVRRDG